MSRRDVCRRAGSRDLSQRCKTAWRRICELIRPWVILNTSLLEWFDTHHFFPTWQECLIWRIASVVIAVTGIAVSFICAIANVERGDRMLNRLLDSILDITETGIIIVIMSFLTFCCSCRVFLVVEAFISIRELPIDAYKTPTWSQLLPHL